MEPTHTPPESEPAIITTAVPAKKARPLSTTNAIIIHAIIVGVCVIAAGFLAGHGPFHKDDQGTADAGATAPAVAVDIKSVKTAGNPFIGRADAPITLAYWSDYQCPYCKQVENGTVATLIKSYVETGKMKIVYKDFVFLGPDSVTAALYEHAIWELYPDKFFDWREAMFAAQDSENAGFGDEASVAKLTATVDGIDATKVKALVAQKKTEYQKEMDADREEGAKFGIKGTPSFITGKTLIPGVYPYTTFAAAIDPQVK